MRRGLATAAAIVMLGAAGCSGDDGTDTPAGLEPAPTATSDGWRTESFGNAEISVPDAWGHQTGDVAAALWCISDAAVSAPVMIRPGTPVESTCPGAEDSGDPDPSTLVEKAGTFVSMVFADLDPDADEGTEGDRVTTKSGGVLVRIQAPAELRAQILGTLHQISTDANGCPVTDPITADPARRPDGAFSVLELKGIKSVAACRYAIPGGRFADPPEVDDEEELGADPGSSEDEEDVPLDSDEELLGEDSEDPLVEATVDPGANLRPTVAPLLPSGTARSTPTLLSSVLLSGEVARDAVHGIAESKVGTGPDSEGGCTGNDAKTVRGTEEIVLRVTTTTGDAQIYLRYGGCHNGFDDGFTERTLTRVAVAPFVSGSNLVPSYGIELLRILDDPNAPATSGNAEEDSGGTAPPEDISEETASASPDPDE
ncbi:hypothetical protein [Sporichthya sp.]|uniref:hypothetical protein n=1 Tax=Sporichthya sp. TaxID=65475 RepID=UPI0017F6FA51|nr:hypothetical protein [Sporichthya sp.]MBA3743903.1 hypothetical protein [Sporichthya sp.]